MFLNCLNINLNCVILPLIDDYMQIILLYYLFFIETDKNRYQKNNEHLNILLFFVQGASIYLYI